MLLLLCRGLDLGGPWFPGPGPSPLRFLPISPYSRGNLKLLGFLNLHQHNLEDDVVGRVSFTGNGRSRATLSIANLTVDDSSTYYCAARRHSGSSLNNQVQQTPKDIYQTKGTSAEVKCSHNINNYDRIFGSSLNDQVQQTPKDIYQTKETTAKIQCSHNINGYNRIFWYKQLSDGQLQLLGYMLGTSEYLEKGVKVQMTGNANTDEKVILTIEERSSGVYYCAASLTVMRTSFSQNKNHSFSSLI
ncbi:hypothetical protein WMY93_016748 [Mugilogobius chulae]|uniref:Ig-like domain-containing protein n=1 Tax=Mugilogobius chulae TaxID=88201 RepID=A0AAW0NLN1_9GOBI